VPYLGVSKTEGFSVLRNSKGISYDRKSNSISAYIGVTASQGEQKKMGFYSNSYKSFSAFDPEFMAEQAVSRATELLGATSIQGAMYPIIFSNRISSSIISMFLSPFYAEAIQKGQSRLAGKLGEKIASDILTFTIDPHIPGMPGSRYFDSEGVHTQKMEVITEGKLNTYLYNLESAFKAKVEPNGFGSRSYSGKAGTGISNLFVKKGDSTLARLLRAYPECIYVTRLEGGSGCSAISGDISIGVQGFLYKNGIQIQPVEKITLSGNYFDLLHKIDDLSSEYSDSYSSIKVPDILVSGMVISG
ncbi:MAG: TldD/PmbA family protein, partial [Spirochaetia bacterium]|nr:TldD/PmbA family protein [Spirochaetia bacterium]